MFSKVLDIFIKDVLAFFLFKQFSFNKNIKVKMLFQLKKKKYDKIYAYW